MMGTYYPAEPLSCLIEKLKKGREFVRAGGKEIDDAMMMYKGITILAHTAKFNKDIRYWRLKTTDLKTWANFETFYHRYHCEKVE